MDVFGSPSTSRNVERATVPLDLAGSGYYSASIRMLLGHDQEAMAILEKAFADGAFSALMSMSSPAFDRIRSEPRFVALWNKAGLPPRLERR